MYNNIKHLARDYIMNRKKIIYLIRDDLRIADNPALLNAARDGQVLIIFIHDQYKAKPRGEAFNWWTYQSLEKLDEEFRSKYNCQIHYYSGKSLLILKQLVIENQIDQIYLNQAFDSDSLKLEDELGSICQKFPANLLRHPEEILNESGKFYKVFTAFWRKAVNISVRDVIESPKNIDHILPINQGLSLDQIHLLPEHSWHQKLHHYWQPGENEARKLLDDFINSNINDYRRNRDFPALQATSKLSPYLAHGEISVVEIWHKINRLNLLDGNEGITCYLTELGWREFSYSLLYHLPSMANEPIKAEFNKFAWEDNPQNLAKWQQGLTGYPIVDAGMRELWETGWMHNRIRMIVGSFLTKDLLIKWQEGERWFWNCLVDADYASNPASWQWVAGCGCDAAPFFRIFNPTTQGRRFDPQEQYTRKWIMELTSTSAAGQNYPSPIIEHSLARKLALIRYKEIG